MTCSPDGLAETSFDDAVCESYVSALNEDPPVAAVEVCKDTKKPVLVHDETKGDFCSAWDTTLECPTGCKKTTAGTCVNSTKDKDKELCLYRASEICPKKFSYLIVGKGSHICVSTLTMKSKIKDFTTWTMSTKQCPDKCVLTPKGDKCMQPLTGFPCWIKDNGCTSGKYMDADGARKFSKCVGTNKFPTAPEKTDCPTGCQVNGKQIVLSSDPGKTCHKEEEEEVHSHIAVKKMDKNKLVDVNSLGCIFKATEKLEKNKQDEFSLTREFGLVTRTSMTRGMETSTCTRRNNEPSFRQVCACVAVKSQFGREMLEWSSGAKESELETEGLLDFDARDPTAKNLRLVDVGNIVAYTEKTAKTFKNGFIKKSWNIGWYTFTLAWKSKAEATVSWKEFDTAKLDKVVKVELLATAKFETISFSIYANKIEVIVNGVAYHDMDLKLSDGSIELYKKDYTKSKHLVKGVGPSDGRTMMIWTGAPSSDFNIQNSYIYTNRVCVDHKIYSFKAPFFNVAFKVYYDLSGADIATPQCIRCQKRTNGFNLYLQNGRIQSTGFGMGRVIFNAKIPPKEEVDIKIVYDLPALRATLYVYNKGISTVTMRLQNSNENTVIDEKFLEDMDKELKISTGVIGCQEKKRKSPVFFPGSVRGFHLEIGNDILPAQSPCIRAACGGGRVPADVGTCQGKYCDDKDQTNCCIDASQGSCSNFDCPRSAPIKNENNDCLFEVCTVSECCMTGASCKLSKFKCQKGFTVKQNGFCAGLKCNEPRKSSSDPGEDHDRCCEKDFTCQDYNCPFGTYVHKPDALTKTITVEKQATQLCCEEKTYKVKFDTTTKSGEVTVDGKKNKVKFSCGGTSTGKNPICTPVEGKWCANIGRTSCDSGLVLNESARCESKPCKDKCCKTAPSCNEFRCPAGMVAQTEKKCTDAECKFTAWRDCCKLDTSCKSESVKCRDGEVKAKNPVANPKCEADDQACLRTACCIKSQKCGEASSGVRICRKNFVEYSGELLFKKHCDSEFCTATAFKEKCCVKELDCKNGITCPKGWKTRSDSTANYKLSMSCKETNKTPSSDCYPISACCEKYQTCASFKDKDCGEGLRLVADPFQVVVSDDSKKVETCCIRRPSCLAAACGSSVPKPGGKRYCLGPTCRVSDIAWCCAKRGSCQYLVKTSNLKCRSGYVMRNSTKRYNEPDFQYRCCVPRALCTNYSCPANWILRKKAASRMCLGENCTKKDVPVCCATKQSCSKIVCKDNEVPDPDKYCKTSTCDNEQDRGNCCRDMASCASFNCTGQWTNKLNAKDLKCKSVHCVLGDDLKTCCAEKSDCSQFSCKDGYYKLGGETRCAGAECNASSPIDHDLCCKAKETCRGMVGKCPGNQSVPFSKRSLYCQEQECDPDSTDSTRCCGKAQKCNYHFCPPPRLQIDNAENVTCENGECDDDTCCASPGFCSVATCPKYRSKRNNSAITVCQTLHCDSPQDIELCCFKGAACTSFDCVGSRVLISNASNVFCTTTTCHISECCVTAPTCAQKFTNCPFGYVLRKNAADVLCDDWNCSHTLYSKCCQVAPVCATLQCPENTTHREPRNQIPCENTGAYCDSSNQALCCDENPKCSSYKCLNGTQLKIHANEITCKGRKCNFNDDNDRCCAPYSNCLSASCPVGSIHRMDDVQCLTPYCQNDAVSRCCIQRAYCGQMDCGPFHYVPRSIAKSSLCVGPFCNLLDDHPTCCVPFGHCQSYPCPGGTTGNPAKFCRRSWCTENDRGTCCETARGMCNVYKCPSGWLPKKNAESISCNAQNCSWATTPPSICCVPKSSCDSFNCPVGMGIKAEIAGKGLPCQAPSGEKGTLVARRKANMTPQDLQFAERSITASVAFHDEDNACVDEVDKCCGVLATCDNMNCSSRGLSHRVNVPASLLRCKGTKCNDGDIPTCCEMPWSCSRFNCESPTQLKWFSKRIVCGATNKKKSSTNATATEGESQDEIVTVVIPMTNASPISKSTVYDHQKHGGSKCDVTNHMYQCCSDANTCETFICPEGWKRKEEAVPKADNASNDTTNTDSSSLMEVDEEEEGVNKTANATAKAPYWTTDKFISALLTWTRRDRGWTQKTNPLMWKASQNLLHYLTSIQNKSDVPLEEVRKNTVTFFDNVLEMVFQAWREGTDFKMMEWDIAAINMSLSNSVPDQKDADKEKDGKDADGKDAVQEKDARPDNPWSRAQVVLRYSETNYDDLMLIAGIRAFVNWPQPLSQMEDMYLRVVGRVVLQMDGVSPITDDTQLHVRIIRVDQAAEKQTSFESVRQVVFKKPKVSLPNLTYKCCTKQATCLNLSCPINKWHRAHAQFIYCQGEECDTKIDEERCCEKRVMCDDFVCTSGIQQEGRIICPASGCTAAHCCLEMGRCLAGYICPKGMKMRPNGVCMERSCYSPDADWFCCQLKTGYRVLDRPLKTYNSSSSKKSPFPKELEIFGRSTAWPIQKVAVNQAQDLYRSVFDRPEDILGQHIRPGYTGAIASKQKEARRRSEAALLEGWKAWSDKDFEKKALDLWVHKLARLVSIKSFAYVTQVVTKMNKPAKGQIPRLDKADGREIWNYITRLFQKETDEVKMAYAQR